MGQLTWITEHSNNSPYADLFGVYVCQAYETQQSSGYLSAMSSASSGYGTVGTGYGHTAGDSATASAKYPSQAVYYQGASAETPSYYTR